VVPFFPFNSVSLPQSVLIIFFQLLYLDNIDFGLLNLSHDTFPRVNHFSSDLLLSMVQADIVEDPTDSSGFTYGRNKVIDLAFML
jgi:hypothetical protein